MTVQFCYTGWLATKFGVFFVADKIEGTVTFLSFLDIIVKTMATDGLRTEVDRVRRLKDHFEGSLVLVRKD